MLIQVANKVALDKKYGGYYFIAPKTEPNYVYFNTPDGELYEIDSSAIIELAEKLQKRGFESK